MENSTNENGQFKPGWEGGPGVAKGSRCGRVQSLGVLDSVMSRKENKKKLQTAMQEAFDDDPLGFWSRHVVPNLPKDRTLDITVQPGMTALTPDQTAVAMDRLTCPLPKPEPKRNRVYSAEWNAQKGVGHPKRKPPAVVATDPVAAAISQRVRL